MKLLIGLLISLFSFSPVYCEEANTEKILSVAEQLGIWNVDEVEITRLGGGQTNDNYKVSSGSLSYFFRCSNIGVDDILGNSLHREWQVSTLLSAQGIAPKVIFYSPREGVLVTDFIESNGRKINLRDKEKLQKFCRMISFVHDLPVQFSTKFCPITTIRQYAENSLILKIKLPLSLLNSLLLHLEELEKFLSTTEPILKPCHLDLHAGNVLDDGKKLWLIDWEYAAMGDPFFDLATAASVENFSDLEMHELLDDYLSRNSTAEEWKYFYCMRILADMRWGLWSYIQEELSTLNDPFEAQGKAYIQNAVDRIEALQEGAES